MEFLDLLLQILEVAYLESGVVDVAGGTVADEGVVVLGALDEGGEGDWHGGLEVGVDEGSDFLAEADELGAEIRVVEPVVEGAASDAGVAGGLGVGGCGGNDGEGGELTGGEVTPQEMCAFLCICAHFRGFGFVIRRARRGGALGLDYGGDDRFGRHFAEGWRGVNSGGRRGT